MGKDSIAAAQLQPYAFKVMVLELAYHIDAGLLADGAHMAQGCRLYRVQPDALLATFCSMMLLARCNNFLPADNCSPCERNNHTSLSGLGQYELGGVQVRVGGILFKADSERSGTEISVA